MENQEIVELIKLVCGIAAIAVAIIKSIQIRKSDAPDTIGLFGIWFFGLLGFLFGVLGHSFQMIEVFHAITDAGDITPSIVANGTGKSLSSVNSGIIILIISVILWGIVKTIKNSQIRKNLTH